MKWNPKDKLYVNPYGWNSKPSRSDEVEYIRKDTLMDWLIDQRDNAALIDEGQYEAYQEVIDKLESM